jgi:hypothetical protein
MVWSFISSPICAERVRTRALPAISGADGGVHGHALAQHHGVEGGRANILSSSRDCGTKTQGHA